MNDSDFPSRLRSARESAGLTQLELAERVGWTQGRLAALERPGGYRPRRETVVRLAAALRCDPGRLLPDLAPLEIPAEAVFLVPDLDLEHAFRPWRPSDAGKLADLGIDLNEPIGHERIAGLAERLREAGLPLCLMP